MRKSTLMQKQRNTEGREMFQAEETIKTAEIKTLRLTGIS